MSFSMSELSGSTVWKLYRMRDRIQVDPDYQRAGGIWAPDNRQLLIDSVINGFDVPKMYLHKFRTPKQVGGRVYDYAIVDGRQRLEILWDFIEGKSSLSEDFEFFKDARVRAQGMTYRELSAQYPDLKADFDGFRLSVMLIETDDLEMIEEMFSRLNEAAPLTAPEKRNAYGGPVPLAIRKLAKEEFFVSTLPFTNSRYRHFDLAAKFLLAASESRIVDTKKSRLDDFVERFRTQPRTKSLPFAKDAQRVIGAMAKVFVLSDPLLRQVGMVTLYFHLFRIALDEGWLNEISRKKLLDFESRRAVNRRQFEEGRASVDNELIEFDSYSQSPNDAGAITFRLSVLLDRVFERTFVDEEKAES